jgi:CRP-like cAMP-binding protein
LLLAAQVEAAEMMPLLNGLDDECLGSMMTLMTQLRLVPGQVLYMAEELGDEMYFLVEGRLQVTRYDNLLEDRLTPIRDSEVAVFEAGDTVGELVLFPDICKYRGETVVARENCTLFVFTRNNLQILSDSHPIVEEKFRLMCTLLSIESNVTNASLGECVLAKERARQSEVEIDVRILELSDQVAASRKLSSPKPSNSPSWIEELLNGACV